MSEPPAPPTWPRRDADHLLVRAAQMEGLEAQLFASGLPVEALMEKAALAVSRRLLQRHGQRLARQGAVVLVGPGHNGGDGLVVARELHLAGIAVALWIPFERLKPLTARHRRHADWLGIPALGSPDPASPALWIDALFGLGQSRPLPAGITALLDERNQRVPGSLVAIDVPTGLCSDTGRCLGPVAACASTTYCIGLIKQGLVQDSALAWVGELERIDLGLPGPLLAGLPVGQPLGLAAGDLADAPWPRLAAAAGKYGRGRVLVVAGSQRFPGAGHLALAGASAAGCGSLKTAGPPGLAAQLQASAPHVVVNGELACAADGSLQLAGLAPQALDRLDAVLVGPGLGPLVSGSANADVDRAAEAQTWQRLQRFTGLLLLDADGLNRLALGVGPGAAAAAEPDAVAWLQQRQGPTWITPHPGEFARLFPPWAPGAGQGTSGDAAVAAAHHCGASVVLKGAHTVIAAPDGRCWQLLEAEPSAARGGLGDVLAGYATALGAMALAAGGPLDPAVLAAASLAHARAGVDLAAGGAGCPPAAIAAELARLTARILPRSAVQTGAVRG